MFNFWTKHKDFLQVVCSSWELPITGSPMVILQTKHKRLKCKLREFNKRHYDDISLKVKIKRQEYEAVQHYNLIHKPDAS